MPPGGRLPVGPSSGRPVAAHAMIGPAIKAMRPRQWLKNVLVFVAPAAAGTLLHGSIFAKACLAFVAFSMTASGFYIFNDIRDLESDRAHVRKRRRPIAAGLLPIPVAAALSLLLVLGGLTLGALATTWQFGLILIAYVVINVAYSIRLKQEPVVELACVASGFLLRAIGGGAATGTKLSVWFIAVISFGALFIVTGKRLAEMPNEDGNGGERRAVLAQYTKRFLESVLTISATITITAYCLWAFGDTGLLARTHGREVYIQLTVVPIVIGALHMLRRLDRGEGGAPEDLAYGDRLLQIMGLAWLALILIGVYA